MAITSGVSASSSDSQRSLQKSRPLLAAAAQLASDTILAKKGNKGKRKHPETGPDSTVDGSAAVTGSPTRDPDLEHPAWNGFLRPAGVDAPIPVATETSGSTERKKKRKKQKESIND